MLTSRKMLLGSSKNLLYSSRSNIVDLGGYLFDGKIKKSSLFFNEGLLKREKMR